MKAGSSFSNVEILSSGSVPVPRCLWHAVHQSLPVKGSCMFSSFSRKLCSGLVNRYLIPIHEHAVFKGGGYGVLLVCANKRPHLWGSEGFPRGRHVHVS